MAEDRIDSIIDLTATQKEVDALEAQIKKVVELIQSTKAKSVEVTTAKSVSEFNKLSKELGGLIQHTDEAAKASAVLAEAGKKTAEGMKFQIQSFKEFGSTLTDSIQKQLALKNRLDEVKESLKKLNEFEEAGKNSKEFADEVVRLTTEQAHLQNALAETNREIKLQVKEINSEEETLKQARAANALLIKQRDETNVKTEEGRKKIAELNLEIDKNNDLIKENSSTLEKVKINIGNYAGSLAGAFDKVTQEIQKLQTKQQQLQQQQAQNPIGFKLGGGEDTLNKTTAALEKLNQVSSIGFKVTGNQTQQVKQLQNAYVELATSGTQSAEFLEQFKEALIGTEEQRPYRQLALAFATAAKEAQDLAAKYGVMDKRSQAAAKRANELNTELKKIDATIGNHQNNVRSYGSALDGVGTKLKNLAFNFLALIGITSVGALFSSSINEFVEMEKNVRQLQNTLKNLGVPEAFDRISASADRLQKKFGFIDNDEILKTFNQLVVYGKLTEDQINDLIPVIIDFATASGQSLADATSTITKALEGNSKGLREFGINMKDASGTAEGFSLIMKELKPRVEGVAAAFADSESGGLAKAKQDFKDLKEEIGQGLLPVLNRVLTFFNEAIKGAKMLAKDIGLLFSGGLDAVRENFDKETTEAAIKAIEERFRNLDVEGRIEERNKLQVAIGNQRKLLADLETGTLAKEGLGDAKRIEQLKKKIEFNNKLLDVLFKIQNEEGANTGKVLGFGDPTPPKTLKDDAAKKAEELAERIRKANFEATKAAQLENIKLQEEIFKDESKSFEERIAALREFVQEKARLIELERTFEKGAKGLTKEEIVAIETKKQTELNQLLRDGHQEYNRILENQQKEEQRLHKENADRIKKIHEDLQKDIEKGLKDANDRLREQIREREEIEKEAVNLRFQLADELSGLTFDILTAQYEKEKNLIQDQIDLLERKKQKDIEVATVQYTNLQERAAAISIINDRAAAEEEILEQKKRAINIKEAQFEKAANIASIIANTAEAIVKSLDKPVLIPLIAAIGAAQLARVIATPIPKYAMGTENHKGGLAVVGDAGKSEGIQLPDGTILKTAATPMTVDLPKGTKVYPDFNHMMLKATLTDVPVFKETTRSDTATPQVLAGLKSVEKAIRKIPQQSITVENIISKKIRSRGGETIYIN